jgi:hypothetical protein
MEVSMNVSKLADSVILFFSKVLNYKCRILAIVPKENGWEGLCEVDVDPNYTMKRGLNDIVEIYEVQISSKLEIEGFTLKETKMKASADGDR